ncbi:MAG: hypothetical protein DRJ64_00995 [Thermoprotei archaeon]|nr:MAG: hypothetical protein DRJ64_00995 [Thermoprotei archaeon]
MVYKERRLRLRRREDVVQGSAKMNPKTMEELNIRSRIEIVIGGKKRLYFNAIPVENIPLNEVWCNSDELRANGVADNTIATVRATFGERDEKRGS